MVSGEAFEIGASSLVIVDNANGTFTITPQRGEYRGDLLSATGAPPNERYATRRRSASWRNQSVSWFQLVKFRLTTDPQRLS